MNIFQKYKKFFPYISGCAFLLYAIIGFFGGVDIIWSVFYAAILALGAGCFLHDRFEKAEIIGITALAVIGGIVIYTIVSEVFAICKILFTDTLGIFMKIQLIISLIPGVVHAAAWVLTFMFSVTTQIKRYVFFDKFWYAPSATFILSALLGIVVNIFIMIINLSFSFVLAFMILKEILLYILIAVAVLLYSYTKKRV